jgi:hypothetical protein
MKGVVNLVRTVCDWPVCLLICLLITGTVGCQTGGTTIARSPGEVCRVYETTYGHGPQSCGVIIVYPNCCCVWQEFGAEHHFFFHQYRPGATYTDELSWKLFSALEKSIHSNHQWETVDGVSTCYFDADDSKTNYPDSVRELVAFARTGSAPQHLTAAEIREKILGTWFIVGGDFGGAEYPGTIAYRFAADGNFESSNSITGEVGEATWTAENGGFNITKGHSLPQNNWEMYSIERLDDQEMMCGHMSVAGRMLLSR